jgi:hypothetical protein
MVRAVGPKQLHGGLSASGPERALLQHTGNHAENPTMSVASRYVFDHCQKPVELIGPIPALEAEIAAQQRAFWAAR